MNTEITGFKERRSGYRLKLHLFTLAGVNPVVW